MVSRENSEETVLVDARDDQVKLGLFSDPLIICTSIHTVQY